MKKILLFASLLISIFLRNQKKHIFNLCPINCPFKTKKPLNKINS
jgi:hypothetical protein